MQGTAVSELSVAKLTNHLSVEWLKTTTHGSLTWAKLGGNGSSLFHVGWTGQPDGLKDLQKLHSQVRCLSRGSGLAGGCLLRGYYRLNWYVDVLPSSDCFWREGL